MDISAVYPIAPKHPRVLHPSALDPNKLFLILEELTRRSTYRTLKIPYLQKYKPVHSILGCPPLNRFLQRSFAQERP